MSERKSMMLPFLLVAFTLSMVIIPSVAATGALYVSPSNIPGRPVGTSVEYQVKVASIDPFNGWDVMVRANQSVIDPVSISLSLNLLTANFSAQLLELVSCVNGSGRGCTSSDGPGIVHSAAVATGSSFITGTASGVVFTITYNVVGGPESLVQPFSDLIVNGSSQVEHSTLGATYGRLPPGPLVGGAIATAANLDPRILYAGLASAIIALTLAVMVYVRRSSRRREDQ